MLGLQAQPSCPLVYVNSYNTQRWYYEECLTCTDRDSTKTFLGRRSNSVRIHLASRRMYHDLNVNCSLQVHGTLAPQMVVLFKMSMDLRRWRLPEASGQALGVTGLYFLSTFCFLVPGDVGHPEPMLGHHEVCLPKPSQHSSPSHGGKSSR